MKFNAYKEIRVAADTMILVRFTADSMSEALDFKQANISGAMAEKWGEAEVDLDKEYYMAEAQTVLDFRSEDGDSLIVRLDENHNVAFGFQQLDGKAWKTVACDCEHTDSFCPVHNGTGVELTK